VLGNGVRTPDEAARRPAPGASAAERPTARFEDVDIGDELAARPSRPPNHEREGVALALLAKEIAENPRNMLQKLAEAATELCDAGTAGVSILDGDVFRWEAVAGVWASARGSSMPRDESPCGICVDRDATQLMHLPDRVFPTLYAEPRFVEGLFVPLRDHGVPKGTVWVVHHDQRQFDREDERTLRVLAQFASAAWQLWQAHEAAHEAYEKAVAAARSKDEFLALLGHELRNPLSPIVTAMQLMRMRGKEEPELGIIQRQVSHLVRLVDDLLDISRITRGKIELRRQPVELLSVVLRGLELASPLFEQRRQEVELLVPGSGLLVQGDADRLAQVVANLLTNAGKYSEPGTKIRVQGERSGQLVRLTVRDQGIGIAPEMLGRIFDTFVQQPQSLDRSTGGLGLGLAIVSSLVALHGGTVEARSAGPGHGSEFVIDLPLARGVEQKSSSVGPSAPPSSRGAAAPAAGKRILVVDDNQDAAETVAEVLGHLGYEVQVARDGPGALEVARTFKPNVCLLDIGLPVMDGYELARRLREFDLPDDLRIIAVTGYGQDADRRRSKEAGFNAHLVKPVNLDTLTNAVSH
jgi:signal transduction histidine kinase